MRSQYFPVRGKDLNVEVIKYPDGRVEILYPSVTLTKAKEALELADALRRAGNFASCIEGRSE